MNNTFDINNPESWGDYLHIFNKNRVVVCGLVNEFIKRGYVPIGGIAVEATLQETIYIQALVRKTVLQNV